MHGNHIRTDMGPIAPHFTSIQWPRGLPNHFQSVAIKGSSPSFHMPMNVMNLKQKTNYRHEGSFRPVYLPLRVPSRNVPTNPTPSTLTMDDSSNVMTDHPIPSQRDSMAMNAFPWSMNVSTHHPLPRKIVYR